MMRHLTAKRLVAAFTLTLTLTAVARTAHADSTDEPPPEIPYEETRPPRPPSVSSPKDPSVPWERHIEVGGDLLYVVRTTDPVGADLGIRYSNAVGFGLHAQTAITEWLHVKLYFVDARHGVTIPDGALGPRGSVDLPTMKSYAFGLRVSPTWQLHPRFRIWATGGAGWGRMEFGAMTIDDGARIIKVRDRADPFIEFPLGLGVSAEIIPRWLNVFYEGTGAFIIDQEGPAVRQAQGIDSLGHLQSVGPFPRFGSSWVQSLGLSLIL